MFETDAYGELFDRIDGVRLHRAAFLAEISAGSLSVVDLFDRASTDPVVASMKVLPAIEALPDSGKVQTRRAFEELDIAEDAHIGDVPSDAVQNLVGALARHAR